MIDLDGATSAVIANGNNSMLSSMIGMGASDSYMKASWTAAIDGSYSLLSPLIHDDHPSRIEVIQYVSMAIMKAFAQHHISNLHSSPMYSGGPNTTTVQTDESLNDMKTFPPSSTIVKMGRSIQVSSSITTAGGDAMPETEMGAKQTENIRANPLSPSFNLLSL